MSILEHVLETGMVDVFSIGIIVKAMAPETPIIILTESIANSPKPPHIGIEYDCSQHIIFRV